MNELKILSLSAEVAPYAKRGGLADVCGSLPKALKALGHDVRVAMPAYQPIEEAFTAGRWAMEPMPGLLQVPTGASTFPAGVFRGKLQSSEVPVYFIAERSLFGDRPEVYGYSDDAYRFAFFCRAALELPPALNWWPDVIHCHDWHAAPAITWLATTGQADPRYRNIATLYTIHNLAHQGRTSRPVLAYLGVQEGLMVEEVLGEVNFMARGIHHATMINTVSPTYAREIMTRDGGVGLDRLLRHRHFDVHGILNGLDYDVWNPSTNKNLATHFDLDRLGERVGNKRALQSRLGLPVNDSVPIISIVSRLDYQKGFDIAGQVIHLLLNNTAGEAQCVVLGSGARQYEDMFLRLSEYHRTKMSVVLKYAPDLAPLVYAGSDMFLMPSRFEPCGLGQLIAMRYGCVPVVRETGGLSDTVHDGITGFTFYDFDPDDLWNALKRALYIYHVDKDSWRTIQKNGMAADFSWRSSAWGYQQLYEWSMARKIT